jgi:hypothetical protein
MRKRHLLLTCPDSWSNDQRGQFFEEFVADLLRPMRFAVSERIRVTGMEIDLLAKGLDQPRIVMVECKAHREPLPSDTISKLLGNVSIRSADAGWLFSTSELGKEAKGQWEEIQGRRDLASKFVWFPPDRLISILIDQKAAVDPDLTLARHSAASTELGDATLVWSPTAQSWLIEILQDGLPALFTVLDAATGRAMAEAEAIGVAAASERFAALEFRELRATALGLPKATPSSPIARVVSGDTWDDLRPARPIDFVGRDDLLQEILGFADQVRNGGTSTRSFAIQGPSGWGKSSLVIKLGSLAGKRIAGCSLTAVDSRSATSAAFVSGALRLAFTDAAQAGLIPKGLAYEIASLTHPLDSPDLHKAADHLATTSGVIVLVFDQFEELFTKEALFETFNAVRELSIDLDSRQIPVVLGFAWKTDVSLPQQHPAYHLWHSLTDRRRDFRVRQFGSPDISKVITHVQRQIGIQFIPALRTRLIEHCQGYPWLLKKLLVHVSSRLDATHSQYALLERELDVESLFKEDLAGLNAEQIRCLKYVAERAPAYVSEVEEHFSPEATNLLLSKRLLVRSGLNYVVYWDIFRDYLIEGRAPQIPWARIFQRDPRSAVRAAQIISNGGTTSAKRASEELGGSERGWVNVMSDLVALQIFDRVAEDSYRLASHIKSTASSELAEHVYTQLARHVVCRELALFDRESIITNEILDEIVEKTRPATKLSAKVIHQYAMNLKRWLLFAGHLEERGSLLYRPSGKGAQIGVVKGGGRKARFVGSSTPDALISLLNFLHRDARSGIKEEELIKLGMRNTVYDALALQVVNRSEDRVISLSRSIKDPTEFAPLIRREVVRQEATLIVATVLRESPQITNAALGEALRSGLQEEWKPTSALRYANGIRRYYDWAAGEKKP